MEHFKSCQLVIVADESLGVPGFVAGYFSSVEFRSIHFNRVAWSAPGFNHLSPNTKKASKFDVRYSPLTSMYIQNNERPAADNAFSGFCTVLSVAYSIS